MTVFDAGRRRSVTDEALAAYDYQVAAYRENVLTGIRQVEDNLAAWDRSNFPERPECCGKLVSSNFN
jgi:outer membrane protein TolC